MVGIMKKSIIIAVLAVFILAGCSSGEGTNAVETTAPAVTEFKLEEKDGVYIVTEEDFLNGVREIQLNPDKYNGKKVQVEGEYIAELYDSEMYYQVYRNVIVTESHKENGHVHTHKSEATPIGFRFTYDGNKPTGGSFVRLIGTLEKYENNGETMLIVRADSVEVLPEGGKVYLNQ